RMDTTSERDASTGTTYLQLCGKLDVFSFGAFTSSLDALFEAEPKAKLICDISGVTYIASSGWPVLLTRRKRARREEGDLILTGMSGAIQRVYESMKLQRLLPSAVSREAALNLIRSGE